MGLLQLRASRWSVGLLVIFMGFTVTSGQGFKEEAPQFNYDTLPATSFSCRGRLTGRYYADAETDCQLFHVCVKMNGRDIQDFKFLCPNGTTFDQEHQVCMDYYQVVCHEGIGTNPLGSLYELLKLSSVKKSEGDLTSGKVSFVDPDVAERNTLGDDFQVDEYNNNRLASSQNSLRNGGSYKSSDIFYKNAYTKSTTTYRPPTTSTRRPTSTRPTSTSTPSPPLVFRSPIPPRGSSPAPPRRPSLETFESYEIESVNAYGANRNSFNTYKNYDDSYEVREAPAASPSSTSTSRPTTSTYRTTTSTTTSTARPQVFHNTYRASPSTDLPTPQTFQQQPSRFNDDFFRKIPSTQTESSVPKSSKYAQFYVNSNTPLFYDDDDFSPKTKQTTAAYRTTSTSTTTPVPRSFDEFPRASFTSTDVIRTSDAPARQLFSSKTSFQGDRGLSNRGTSSSKDSLRQSKFFSPPQSSSTSESDPYIPRHSQGGSSLSPKITHHSRPAGDQEEFLRPRSYSGTSSGNNVNQNSRQFSTAPPPPTTSEPSTESTTYGSSGVTNSRGVTYFQRVTTLKPEKFSIFFKSTPSYSPAKDSFGDEKYSTSFYESSTTTRRPPPTTTAQAYTEEFTSFDNSRTSAPAAASFDSFRVTQSPKTSTTDYFSADATSTTSEPLLESTTTGRALRRGPRRRVSRPRTPPPKDFDSEFKYSRRVVDASHLPKPQKVKSAFTRQRDSGGDEIFNAEASVYNGQPKANLFQEDRKEVSPSAPTTEDAGASDGRNKLVENFGRKIRPGGLREQFVRAKQVIPERSQEVSTTEDASAGEQTTHSPRRLIKRLKVKTTAAPTTTSTSTVPSTTSTPTSTTTTTTPTPPTLYPFIGGSTLRPVKRINVKTKVLGTRKLEKSYDFSSSSSTPFVSTKNPFATTKNPFSSSPFEKLHKITTAPSTTTAEPQLITASDEEILRKKSFLKLSTPFGLKETTTPTTYRPPVDAFLSKKLNHTTTSVIVKVPRKPQEETFPISFKEPILSSGRQETRVEVKASTREESSSATRSPDYDYAYYNTDSDDDYSSPDAASRLTDSKNYGKKPRKTLKLSASI